MRTYFIMWYRTDEWAPSAPTMKSNSTSISLARPVALPVPWTSNQALQR